VNQAMEERTNQSGDFIKNQSGYAFYIDSQTGWIGSLRFMNPGEGFMLQSIDSGSFEYPEYGSRNFDDFPEYEPLVLRDAPDWSVNPQDYEYTANLTIELQINDFPATSGNYMIGAFVGEECRGSATPIEALGTWLYFLTVYSNTPNESIDLMVYVADIDEIVDPQVSFEFANDLILGSPSSPYRINIAYGLDSPKNVIIEIIGTNVQISWDEVDGANSYKIYASDDPYGTFRNVTSEGSFGRELIPPSLSNKSNYRYTWTSNITGMEKKFYYVVASSEEVRSVSKN
jgi:hypothetical protein